jgi:hypothetical protein
MEGISLLQEGNELNSKTITNTNTNTNSQTKISTKNRLQIKTSEKLSEKIKEKEQYTLIDFPEKGFINNNPVPNQINTIGTDIYPSKSNMNEKKTDAEIEARKKKLKDQANEKAKAQEKIKINEEIEKSQYLPFPITRKERPYELEDSNYDKLIKAQIKLKSEENKRNNLRGFSFLQKKTDNEIFDDSDFEKEKQRKKFEDEKNKADEKIINVKKFLKQMKLTMDLKKKKTKENLENCKKKCIDTCKRFISFSLKNESFDLCKVKCQLACTENALNILIN